MKTKTIKFRSVSLAILLLGVFVLYGIRLMELQVVEGEYYKSQTLSTTQRTQVVKAARGEMVDRYGNSLAINRSGFDIVFNKAFIPSGNENETISKLIQIFQETGAEWIDNLPLSGEAPYSFLEGRENSIAKLKSFLEVAEYSDEEIVLHWLIEKYKLQEYSEQEARLIAGVRYEMEQTGYNLSTPYTFAEDVDKTLAAKISELSTLLPGVSVSETPVREYPNGDVAPHIIGNIGPIYAEEYAELDHDEYAMDDTIGKSGLEKAFESELRGVDGETKITLDHNYQVTSVEETKAPTPGKTLMLTIDSDLQRVAQQALRDEIAYLQANAKEGEGKEADAGAVVVIDVKTGDLLAAVTEPTYDLSTFLEDYDTLLNDDRNPLFNRAFQGTYAAGSIYKPAVAIAGLTEGVVTPTETILCNHVYTRFTDYQPTCMFTHGNINVMDALRHSCNIYFYETGYRLGISTLNKYSTMLGLGQKTGIEMYEETGHLASPEVNKELGIAWEEADVIQAAIGQATNLFTPLQLANYAATIANKGVRYKVNLIKQVSNYDFTDVEETTPTVAYDMRNQVPEEVFDTVIEGMRRASGQDGTYGTARAYLGDYPILIGSKTGTPQTEQFPNATFICFAPLYDPEIAIAVVIEDGWHGYNGAPVARAIFDQYFFGKSSSAQVTDENTALE